jgi:hypothetical protein
MALPDFFQQSEEQIAATGGAQERLSAITAASDEVQIMGAVIAFESARHARSMEQWPPRCL